jgi:hypothetical protein
LAPLKWADDATLPHFLTRCDLLVIRQTRQPGPSIINEKPVADFVRAVERANILRQAGGEAKA